MGQGEGVGLSSQLSESERIKNLITKSPFNEVIFTLLMFLAKNACFISIQSFQEGMPMKVLWPFICFP